MLEPYRDQNNNANPLTHNQNVGTQNRLLHKHLAATFIMVFLTPVYSALVLLTTIIRRVWFVLSPFEKEKDDRKNVFLETFIHNKMMIKTRFLA